MRKPYLRKQTSSWYVKDENGKDIPLGRDKDEAFRRYFELMATKDTPKPAKVPTVSEIVAQFLDWSAAHQAPRSTKLYRFFCDSFTAKYGKLNLSDLKPFHVSRWLDDKGYTGNGGNAAVRSVTRPFNWAVKMGMIDKNPIAGAERPSPTARECYLTPEQYGQVIAAIPDEEFRDFVTILRETGCRPQEACAVEARHFDRAARTWTFPVKESKGKKRQRIVILNDRAFAITQRLALKNPTGPLFRNLDGRGWNANNLNCRWRRLSAKLGFHVFSYALRHAFCTDALLRGVPPMELAILMGHASIDMIWKVYNKLQLQMGHLRDVMKRATGEVA